MQQRRRLGLGGWGAAALLMVAVAASHAFALPFEVIIDISPDGGQLEAGGVAIPESATPANNANNFNVPATAMTTPGGDPFTVAINNLNALGVATGAIDWRDRGNAGAATLLRLAEDFVKNNSSIVRITLGDLPAGSYAVTSYHVDPDNTQCEAIKVLVSDAVNSNFTYTGAVGNARLGGIVPNVAGLTTGIVQASSATFYVTSNGADPVSILFDGSAALDKEAPLNGLWVRPGTAPARVITSAVRSGASTRPQPYYVTGGLKEDALAYNDRVHEWNALPAALPELVGADYIRIANDDRDRLDFRMNVGLAQQATAYILWDSRVAAPSWFAPYGFTNTGETIWMDEAGDGSNNTLFHIYWGNFPAGSVDLFSRGGGTATNAMYGVAAVAGQLAPNAHVYTPLGTGKTFLEQAGQVVIEAENYTSRTLVAGDTDGWFIVPDERGPAGALASNARGGKYVQSLPDDVSAGGPTVPPSIEYQVQISTPGQYRLYLRWDGNTANTGQSDSIFVDIKEIKDGVGVGQADWYELDHGIDGNFSTDPWDGSGQAEIDTGDPAENSMVWTFPAPGIYTVRVSQREDGSSVDALIFQLSSGSTPADPGPPESRFSSGVPILLGYSKLGGDPDATHPLGVASGLAEGVPAFADAVGNWTSIPPELLGADYIRTENGDAGYGFADYSLIAGEDAYLYLFLDDRYIAANGMPSWMLDMGFVDIGLDVILDNGNIPFSVFQFTSVMDGGVPVSVFGLGYDLIPAYDFYGIAVSDFAFFAIPEPGTSTLLGLGVLALLRRRRRARGKP